MNEIYVLTSVDYDDRTFDIEAALSMGRVFWDLDSAKRAAEAEACDGIEEDDDLDDDAYTPSWSVWEKAEPQDDLDEGELRLLGSTGWTCEEAGIAFLIRGYAR